MRRRFSVRGVNTLRNRAEGVAKTNSKSTASDEKKEMQHSFSVRDVNTLRNRAEGVKGTMGAWGCVPCMYVQNNLLRSCKAEMCVQYVRSGGR